jgi:hypothetical protein
MKLISDTRAEVANCVLQLHPNHLQRLSPWSVNLIRGYDGWLLDLEQALCERIIGNARIPWIINDEMQEPWRKYAEKVLENPAGWHQALTFFRDHTHTLLLRQMTLLGRFQDCQQAGRYLHESRQALVEGHSCVSLNFGAQMKHC